MYTYLKLAKLDAAGAEETKTWASGTTAATLRQMAKISRRRKKKTPSNESTLATPHVPDKSLAFSLIADFLDRPRRLRRRRSPPGRPRRGTVWKHLRQQPELRRRAAAGARRADGCRRLPRHRLRARTGGGRGAERHHGHARLVSPRPDDGSAAAPRRPVRCAPRLGAPRAQAVRRGASGCVRAVHLRDALSRALERGE